MKKINSIFFISILIMCLTACNNNESNSDTANSPIVSQSDTQEIAETQRNLEDSKENETPESESAGNEGTEVADSDNILIAYFTRTGSTETIAEMIQEQVGGEMFQIQTTKTYASDYDTLLDEAQEEQRNDERPELAENVGNLEDYDTIYIGYPIWWGDTPMVILSFLESHDFTGKTVIPFCTHGGGGSGSSFQSVESAAVGAEVLDGFSTAGSGANSASDAVGEWLNGL